MLNQTSKVKKLATEKLSKFGLDETFYLKVRNPKKFKNSSWVALYRSYSQFHNGGRGPIFWISERVLNNTEQSIISVCHEYGHVIAEWAWVRSEKISELLKNNFEGRYYNRPWDEEEFAESFAHYVCGYFSFHKEVFDKIIDQYISELTTG